MANYQSVTDEQLVKAYADGSNEAFDTLLKRHQDRVFNYILRIIKNEDLANDIFQETFVKAILTIKQGRYTENGKFPAWISRIAHNLIIDYYRQEKSENVQSADMEDINLLNRKDLCEATIEVHMAAKTGVSINTALGRMRYAIINLRRIAAEKEIILTL